MSELLSAQRAFSSAILSRQAETGLLDLLDGEPEHNTALIAIYRGNAVTNTRGALRLAYPVCEQIVGAECFSNLARLYWRAHPAQSGDLNQYGQTFADFIAHGEEMASLPWLADVAKLEWAVHQASMAADHQPISMHTLASLSPAQLAASGLQCQAALQTITSDWPIVSIWQQHQATYAAELDLSGCGAEIALIHREGLAACVSSLSACEAACILTLQADTALEPALIGSSASSTAFTPTSFLQRLFALELIVGITPGENS